MIICIYLIWNIDEIIYEWDALVVSQAIVANL
jgi:hypothetical protein